MSEYRTIVADPPWDKITTVIGAGGRRANATTVDYADRLMSTDEIAALPVGKLAAAQAHLYLWATRKAFREGDAAKVARAWGFEPVGELIWGLRNPGTGSGMLTNGHEPILLASRGRAAFPVPEPMQSPGGVYYWKQVYEYGPAGVPQKVHSAKPPAFLDFVERVSQGPYCEMFARTDRMGWDQWGDESNGTAALEAAA